MSINNCKTNNSIFNWLSNNDGVLRSDGVCVKMPEQCVNQMPSYSPEPLYRNPMQSQYPIRQNGGSESGSVTPYSPYIWRQQGSYPSAVGGGKRRRKKGTKAKKSRKIFLIYNTIIN